MSAPRVQTVRMPYAPRKAFVPFHKRTQRWACLVAHRRAGKTVAAVNDLIRAAITAQRPHAHYAYVAPYRSQAKSVAWDYLKRFAALMAFTSTSTETSARASGETSSGQR